MIPNNIMFSKFAELLSKYSPCIAFGTLVNIHVQIIKYHMHDMHDSCLFVICIIIKGDE